MFDYNTARYAENRREELQREADAYRLAQIAEKNRLPSGRLVAVRRLAARFSALRSTLTPVMFNANIRRTEELPQVVDCV